MLTALLVLGEAMGTPAEKCTVQHLPGFIFLSVCPGERKSTDKQDSGRWEGAHLPLCAVKVSGRLESALFLMQ